MWDLGLLSQWAAPWTVAEEQSSTSPPCSEGTEEHKKGNRAVQSRTGRGTDSTQHACVARAAWSQADRETVRTQRACGTGMRDRAGHGTVGSCWGPDTSRRAVRGTVGRTGHAWQYADHTGFRGTDRRYRTRTENSREALTTHGRQVSFSPTKRV